MDRKTLSREGQADQHKYQTPCFNRLRFSYMPEANRHYAARAQEALDAILVPPNA